MNKKTILVPFRIMLDKGLQSHVMHAEVEGYEVGPLLVHRSISKAHKKWMVTHIATGFSCCDSPSKKSAITAAERLGKAADWNFTDPSTVKSWSEETMKNIHLIRTASMAGGV